MPLSEIYVVQRLVQGTLDEDEGLLWSENEDSGGHAAKLNGVSIELVRLESNTGSRLCLTFTHRFDKVHIAEPVRRGLLRPRYATDDDQQLAERMNELEAAVARQCSQRRLASENSAAALRDAIFRRLLFGDGKTSDSTPHDRLGVEVDS